MAAATDCENTCLTGIWVAPDGTVHQCFRDPDGQTHQKQAQLEAFMWVSAEDVKSLDGESHVHSLKGSGPFNRMLTTSDMEQFGQWMQQGKGLRRMEVLKPYESQYLLSHGMRLFGDLRFDELKRCQLDIETEIGPNGKFPSSQRQRVLAIGLKMGEKEALLSLDAEDDASEKALLEALNQHLEEWDPDVIEGHNIFNFDLEYLRVRAGKHKVRCAWGRFGQEASFRKSRLKVAERWVDFQRCDLPGRTVFDTYLMVQLYDLTSRDMTSYGLKAVAKHFGVTKDLGHDRTYIKGDQIHATFKTDRARFLGYLRDDLLETEGVAAILLPTYFEQCRSFPTLLQEASLRGTSSKIDLLFFEKYYQAGYALPDPVESIGGFEGGYTQSFRSGVFRDVFHYDVASLYPSLLIRAGRNPANDDLGVFLPLLEELRTYRLRYKSLAKSEKDPALRREYGARQATFKILINSFYGYLGFQGARFGDPELAAQVTSDGRALLQSIIDRMHVLEAEPLEADTDGIYVCAGKWAKDPEGLLAKVREILPDGIELEFDGAYDAMLCYKSKNYALNEGGKVIIRGSALRSRGIEPFLRDLTENLVQYLLGGDGKPPAELMNEMRESIGAGTLPVKSLAKMESLNQNPAVYAKSAEEGKTPRRAALEVALRMNPVPKQGDRVVYYIAYGEKGRKAMWQRAYALSEHDPVLCPYDPGVYLKKLDEWEEKFADLLEIQPGS